MTGRPLWRLLASAPPDVLAALGDLPPLAAQLLYNRGIRHTDQARAYLGGSPAPWPDPLLLPDMQQAVDRLLNALRHGEETVVYGDFDADGITGTALLVQGLRRLGVRAHPYIPHRDREGYGLNIPALETLHAQGVSLVVSVDCGTSSVEEITHARGLGMDLVVVDHHAIPPQLPPAVAIVNPHRRENRYPFNGFSGVGVAFKLLQALYAALGEDVEALAEHLDLVAIGTVADVAPLHGENRWLVQQGLAVINGDGRPGLRALRQRAGLEKGGVDAGHLGYVVAPRLNAMGRLEHAMTSYQLLATQDAEEARSLAEQLETTNQARQRITREALEHARVSLEHHDPAELLVMVDGEEYAAGVMGLVASSLAEEWYRPAVVVERGPAQSRGSARSIPEFSIVGALAQCRELLVRYGGHPQAAGFTVETALLPALRERLSAVATEALAERSLQPTLCIDLETPLRALPGATLAAVRRMEPFGAENPEPLFLTRRLEVTQARTMGRDESHLELKLREGRVTWRAVGFGMGLRLSETPREVDMVYTVAQDSWQGHGLLQLQIRDFRPSGP